MMYQNKTALKRGTHFEWRAQLSSQLETQTPIITMEGQLQPASEDRSVQNPNSMSLGSSSTLAHGQPESSVLSQQNVATIIELLNVLAAKRTDSSLRPDAAPGAVPSEPARPVPTPVTGSVQTDERKREDMIFKIETVFQGFADAILEDRELVVMLSSRRPPCGSAAEQDTQQPEPTSLVGHSREIRFPGSTSREAWTFTVVVRILELIHEALVNKLVTTKRDMFYKDPSLFVKQSVVDRFVDDIACTFGTERISLNVVAAAKGLILGPLKITRCNGSVLDCATDEEGTLVPNGKEIRELDMLDIRWILVIEKEATFRSLAASKFWQTPLMGQGLLVTAKGYPDISTRYLLRLLSTHPSLQEHWRPPLYGLVDFDPDGIAIMSTYKHGSIALAHEDAQLRIPALRRLGVRSKDIMMLDSTDDEAGLLRLTLRDRRKACQLLENKVLEEDGQEIEWRRDLQYMLMLNIKAEIQILSNLEGGLERWLGREITAAYLAGG